MLSPDGRVILVSGASRGIGRAVTENLLAAGFRVSAGMRNPDALPPRENLMTSRYDAEDASSVESWVAATREKRADALRWRGAGGAGGEAILHGG